MNNSFLLLSFLVCFFASCTNGHLVLMNGKHVKEQTPAKPHEVDAFIHTLRRYAEETFGSRTISEGKIVDSSSISNYSVNATSAGHENGTNLVFDGSHGGNERFPPNIWAKTHKNVSNNNWPKTSVVSIVHDTLHSILKSFGDNASRPEIFKTNFVLKHSEETD